MSPLVERFLRYIQIPTQSAHDSQTVPSTERQFNLAKVLGEELKELGFVDVQVTDHAYVLGRLKGNCPTAPTIGFCSHIDTALDVTDENMRPRIVKNYDGGVIHLDEAGTVNLDPDTFPSLKDHIGDDLIVTDGTTLLGADDKAGIAEIITACEELKNSTRPHGDVVVCFCPDEEIGHGASLLDIKAWGADVAYTLDAMGTGVFNYETFNAAWAKVEFIGRSVHPGSAKNSMINAVLLATEFINHLPPAEAPAHTEEYEGFYHVCDLNVSVESGVLNLILRDHDDAKLTAKKDFIALLVRQMNERYGKEVVKVTMGDSYKNMRDVVMQKPEIVEKALQAIRNVGLEPIVEPVRGGTDGSQLSARGLPTPNIFYGGYNAHGKYEYASVQAMEKAVATVVELVHLWAC